MQNRFANKFKKISPQRAFTLAEVLITLGIIGVVAALTIPALMKSSDELRSKTTFKNTYKLLSEATLSIKDENGGTLEGAFGKAQAGTGSQTMLDAYTEKLNFIQICRNYEAGCWATSGKTLYGTESSFGINGGWVTNGILKNGVYVGFQNIDENCLYSSVLKCGQIFVDTNGLKSPNQAGYDMFLIAVQKDRLSTLTGYSCILSDSGARGGYGCSYNVMMGIPYDP